MVALSKPLPTPPASPRRVAVLLNANARKVDDETLRWVSTLVPEGDLYVSRSIEESHAVVASILERDYGAVLLGGGDGTFAQGIAALTGAAHAMGCKMPEVGVLALGTGNAVASALGAGAACPRDLAENLHRARYGTARRRLQMLNVEGRPSLFAGFGLDAQILDDHGRTVDMLKRMGLADKVQNANVRYLLSVSGMSLPRFLATERVEVVAVNRGAPALAIDVNGQRIGNPIPAGKILWRGDATLASASTIPYFGLGMRMFPHAERLPGRFQLRLCDAGAMEVLANIPFIWHGRHLSRRVNDFLVDKVELQLSRPAPFQSNGDVLGDRNRIELSLWEKPVLVV